MVDPAGTYRDDRRHLRREGADHVDVRGRDGAGKAAVLAEACLADLKIGEDGELELIVGGPEERRTGCRYGPESSYFSVRQFIATGSRTQSPTSTSSGSTRPTGREPDSVHHRRGTRPRRHLGRGQRGSGTSTPTASKRMPDQRVRPAQTAEGGAVNMVHGGCQWRARIRSGARHRARPAGRRRTGPSRPTCCTGSNRSTSSIG